MDDQEEPATCGRGLAMNAVIPSALAAVTAGMAQNLEVHSRALDLDDPGAEQEQGAYEYIARTLRSAATDLRAAAAEMVAAADMPMGAHDMAAMTTTDVLDAFERYAAAEEGLRRLLEARRADNEQMLAMIRAAVGGHDGG